MPEQDFKGALNGIYAGSIAGIVPAGTTKTFTFTLPNYVLFDISVAAMQESDGSGYSSAKFSVIGFGVNATFYVTTEVLKANTGCSVVSSVTEGSSTLSFTIQNTDGARTVGYVVSVNGYGSSLPAVT